MKLRLYSILLVQICLWGCTATSEETGEGTLSLELYGEDFIEQGIPSAEFADGYSVHFETFLINLGEVDVTFENGTTAFEAQQMRIWDLTSPGPVEVAQGISESGMIESARYKIAPADEASIAGNVSDEERELMVQRGLSIYVEGTATRENTTKSFRWGFMTDTAYGPCAISEEMADEKTLKVEITIHGDHLYYDDAISEDPGLRFHDIALADSDGDGYVSQDELVGYDISGLEHYDVGNLDIDNLWDFLSHMTTTLGHLNGEGHCD